MVKDNCETLAGSGADVGDEASTAGLWLSRALLTWLTPGSANGGTAQSLGAHNTTHLALAHLVGNLGETRTRSVVCEGKRIVFFLEASS